jgi:hypothetical protein
MNEADKRNLVAQWAFDTRPVLERFHLWLEDVEVDRAQTGPVSARTFMPRGVARCLAMTSAATALGTRLFGRFGAGKGSDKAAMNRVKKSADAISAYVMSEGLWHLTRTLPETHAVMVSLGEGLMPKAGETPEMGANPLLGFGRVYARPEVARQLDALVHRLLNDPEFGWTRFYGELRDRRITVWGVAVDTLENTTRFSEGRETGPMTVLHIFDSPLRVTRPYESYFGCLTVPGKVAREAERASVLLDFCTPRAKVLEVIQRAYPGVAPERVHVWTLRGKSRAGRLAGLWDEWNALGVHLVDDGWKTPAGLPVFTDSGTYAPAFMVRAWEEAGETHVFLCDGYAASAEAVQAASLCEVLDIDSSMAPFSPTFELPHDREYQLMKLSPDAPDFADALARMFGAPLPPDRVARHAAAIRDAVASEVPLGRRVLRADDFLPEKGWHVLACLGYICDDPYTGVPGVEPIGEDRYRVTTQLATREASSRIAFTFRLSEGLEHSRLVFSPLLVRILEGADLTRRAVNVSDSGRIRNELQTMFSQALAYEGDRIRVLFDRIEDSVLAPADRQVLRGACEWYKRTHPVWFDWLEVG